MPALEGKIEVFAQAYALGPTAGNAAKSAEFAGWKAGKSAQNTGYKLSKRADVVARVAEIQAGFTEATGDSLKAHLAQLERIRTAAIDAKQYTAAARAEELRGKALGYYVERIQVSSDVPDSELLLAVAQLLPNQAHVFAALLRRTTGSRDPLDVVSGGVVDGKSETLTTSTG